MEQQPYMGIVRTLLELLQLLQLAATLHFLAATHPMEKHPLQEFVGALQDQIKFAVLELQQHQEAGVIIAAHIMDKFVVTEQQDTLHVIVERVQAQNHLQIQDHVHVHLHLPLHAIVEHVQE